jgi:hypothetical protein
LTLKPLYSPVPLRRLPVVYLRNGQGINKRP